MKRIVLALSLVTYGCTATTAAQLGIGTYVDGSVTARGVKPLPAFGSFYVWERQGTLSLEEKVINECLAAHLRASGLREVVADAAPDVVVAFTFNNGGSPIGYRAKAVTLWGDEARASSTAVWDRRFSVLVFNAEEEKPVPFWQAEVSSKGSTSSVGPLAYTFLAQAFARFRRDATAEPFRSPLLDVCQAR